MSAFATGVIPVAEGVFALSRAGVNAYLIARDGDLVLVDAGLPGTWRLLVRALDGLDATASDLDAVLLTHGHFDHVGMCERLIEEHRILPHVHPDDEALVRHPYRYDHEAARWVYPLRYPRAVPVLTRMLAAGALGISGTLSLPDLAPGEEIPLAGGITPIAAPGHTFGHCGFSLPDGVLFTGDALVTLDPYTGRTGPRVVARAATAQSERALASLDALEATGARIVLPGHGDAWTDGVTAAARIARTRGVD